MSNAVVRPVANIAIPAILLMIAAGSADWPQAWWFLALFSIGFAGIGIWLRWHDPALFAERMTPASEPGQRTRDKAILHAISVTYLTWLIFMGLDRRFGWSGVSWPGQVLGATMMVAAFVGCAAVLSANTFAVPTVRTQPERGQYVIEHGPYRVVRHPMYSCALLLTTGIPLVLGSLWGVAWIVPFVLLFALRACREEEVIRDVLPGYRSYMEKVRCRLLPGVW